MNGEAKDPYTRTLEKKVSCINNDDEWKVSYMTWAIKLADERREAREEGRKEGREEGRLKQAKKTAANMQKRGSSFDEIAEVLELPADTIRAWAKEADMLV